MHKFSKYKFAGLFGLALIWASAAFGQGVTTASISGFVTDNTGHPVAGAKVEAVHVPSGTVSDSITRSNGEYNLTGLRTGGPYTITAAAPAFTAQSTSGITLEVGAKFTQDFTLSSEVVKMQAVNVVSLAATIFDTGQIGTATTFDSSQIGQIVSVRQDVQDVANLDPRANLQQSANGDANYTISFMGQNPRENLILVDGVTASDNFGLNSNGYAALRSPVPIPWIESFSLALNDYDIALSGFMGAAENMTLKSGTNDFHGSLYALYSGTRFRGPDPVVGVLGPHEAYQSHTTGATIGGPILKDKLFFFVGYEAFRELAQPPPQQFIPTDNAADTAVVNSIIAKAQSLGDTNTGSFVVPIHSWEQNFVAKVDWNISDDHRFEFTFRHTDGLYPLLYNYTSSFETSLSGSWYSSHRIDQSYTAKINSNWDKFLPGLTSEVEATYRKYNGTAELFGTDSPSAVIENVNGTSTAGGSPPFELYLGPSPFYQYNALYTEELEEHAYGEYSAGAHTFKFGAQVDRMQMFNAFIPNFNGTYTFTNVTDYLNQQPTGVSLVAPAPGFTVASAVAHYAELNVTPLIQDTWKPSEALTFVAGLRLDYPFEPQKPPFNPIYAAATGMTNQTTIDGHSTLSPRFGFTYDLPTKRKTQVRGGAGLFLGAPPFVWLENSFSTAGQLSTYTINNSSVPIANFTYTGNPKTQPLPPVTAAVPTPSLDVLSNDFHMPANWKENLAVDHELPWWHLVLTLEGDFSQVQKDVTYYQTNLKLATSGPATMPDGRLRYNGNITPSNIGSANFVPGFTTSNFYTNASSQSTPTLEANPTIGPIYELANTDKGGGQEYTIQISRPMIDDWSGSIAYTHSHVTQVSTLGGTTASGGFGSMSFVNPNDNVAYPSAFAEPNKIVVTGTKRFHFFKIRNSATTISADFIVQTGVPFSYVFKGDPDGSGNSGASLFYVPSGPNDPKVAWLSQAEENNFFNNWLPLHPDLEKYAGRIAPRNEFYSAWERTLNLHMEQEVPIYGSARMVVFGDCFNFANLLNRNWGIVDNFGVYNDQGGRQTVAGTGYNPAGNGGQGQYIYVFNPGTISAPTIYSDQSRWYIQVGARIEF